eukprot:m51a1_g10527 hypothetical protein (210) ;mRNA; f:231210-231959
MEGPPPEVASIWPRPPEYYFRKYAPGAPIPPPVPPRPPRSEGPTKYVMPSLEDNNLRQLYPKDQIDASQLVKLNHSLLFNFLQLLEVMTDDTPTEANLAAKCEDITLLFQNMYHLLNGYREHQAWAELVEHLYRQDKRHKECVARLRGALDAAKKGLEDGKEELRRVLPRTVAAPSAVPAVDDHSVMSSISHYGGDDVLMDPTFQDLFS